MASLVIESAGPGTTIQDGGRFGLLRYGVTPAGPMDWVAFRAANLALGNVQDAAAIEIASGGIALNVDAPIIVAFAGGGFSWTRGERGLPTAARVLLRPGETLRAQAGDWGSFAYCAVPGGVNVPEVMGSRATHTRSALGGLDGRALRGGDRLAAAREGDDLDDSELIAPWLAQSTRPIRVVLGPQDDHFTDEAIAALLNATFTRNSASDRMAYKLEGPKLQHKGDFNIVSDGVALGAIQVAGDGQPMVLMADRQPTGGYPKIAHVCRADIARLAQMRAGDVCRFEAVSASEARKALVDVEARLVMNTGNFKPLRTLPTAAALSQADLVSGVFGSRDPA